MREPPAHSRIVVMADSENGIKAAPAAFSEMEPPCALHPEGGCGRKSRFGWIPCEQGRSLRHALKLPTRITDFVRGFISWRHIKSPAITAATGIPKATLSRFLNGHGSLNNDKLSTLADYLGLSLVYRVRPSDHVDEYMAAEGNWDWWKECDRRCGDDDDAAYDMQQDAAARAEWEVGFRQQLEQQERKHLEAIPWIVIVDESEFHRD